MDSSLAASGYGWLAAALGGAAAGWTAVSSIRALAARLGRRGAESRRAVSMIFLSLSAVVASGAGLLILPPKPLLAEHSLWIWAGAWVVLGVFSFAFPRCFGIPLTLLGLTALVLAGQEACAWHPLAPGREIARFVPYAVTDSASRGDFSVPDRNAVPVLSKIEVESRECSLEARILELSGPLASLFGGDKYLLVRLTDGKGSELLKLPEKPGPLRSYLIGGKVRLPWVSVRVERSGARELRELAAVSWAFDPDGRLQASFP